MTIQSQKTLFIALLLTTQGALADPRLVEVPVKLSFPPGTPADEVYVQIRKAAYNACRSRTLTPHRHLAHEANCRNEFIEDAVAALDRTLPTALHLERTGLSRDAQVAERNPEADQMAVADR